MARYKLNPFCQVTETPGGFVMNALPDFRVTFPRSRRDIVDVLLRAKSLSGEDLLKLVAQTRLTELIQKKVIVADEEIDLESRYSRQTGFFTLISDTPRLLSEKLGSAHVLVLGAGAIGSHVAWNLAAMGVGRITILDFDTVEKSNLNRQALYTPGDLGKLKVEVLADRIRAFNPDIEVVAINGKIESEADVASLLSDVSLVIKAIDTPEKSIFWVNASCVRARIPFLTGGFLDCVGVVGPNYMPGHASCYACLGDPGQVRRLHGIGATFGPLAAIVAGKIAMIAFKILTGEEANFADNTYSYDSRTGEWAIEKIRPVARCDVCGAEPASVPPALKSDTNLLLFRICFLTFLTSIFVLREFFGQVYVGVIGFFGMLAILPIICSLYENRSILVRREIFVCASIYILYGVCATIYDRASLSDFHLTLSSAATIVSSFCMIVTQAAASIMIFFLAMSSIVTFAPKVREFLNETV